MAVLMYPDGDYAEIGELRWEVEWNTAPPVELGENWDPADLPVHMETFMDEVLAVRRANEILRSGVTFFGAVTVRKARAEWLERPIGTWEPCGDPMEVS